VADKTGTGSYGTANDVGVLWPPDGEPVVLVVFTNRGVYGAEGSSETIAAATRLALAWE
jgi:beta-lactamase class A